MSAAAPAASAAHHEHLRHAVAGYEAALSGDHRAALGHYRDAMRVAVHAEAPEVFFRHYLEASLESLELIGAWDDVLEYCDRAIEHYRQHPPPHDVAMIDLASIHQRRGLVLLKRGDISAAREALADAIAVADRAGARLELAARVIEWLRRGLTISPKRVLDEQRGLHYFSVRPGVPRLAAPDPAAPHSTRRGDHGARQ
jgi:tetratricopeptide (TPR) repeat protein